jgi:hypothetical protein
MAGVAAWDTPWTWNWFYDHEYHAKLIARLASVGNPDACLYGRMRAIFVEDRTMLMPWLDMLELSAMAGHDVVAFVLSPVLPKSNSGASNDNIKTLLVQEHYTLLLGGG